MGYMPEIGLVIVDEVHLIVSRILSTGFQYLTPSYMIGLSATPYRMDGLDVLLELYFGSEKVDRQLQRKHFVYKVDTNFIPIVNRQLNGKVDWNDILNQQSIDEKRNDMIIKTLCLNINLNFMVLCKRIEQIKILQHKLKERGIEAEYIYGDIQPDLTKQTRILIGTPQKLGTGFDAPWLNALLVASDLEAYFIQYLGRVFRKQDIVPIIFDFVDQNSIMKKHYKTREMTYKKHGGIIKNLKA
jgi:superfamily II DNA or RNA helicase